MRVAPLVLLFALPALADDEGSKVYKKTVPSVVWIHAKHDKGVATGSGSLIDADRKLVLTNYHVVEEQPRVNVYFPAFRDGQPIAEKSHYLDKTQTLAIGAKVVARDKKADLAIVQLDHLPVGKTALALAPASAEPGQSVHSIGNTGKSGALWGYVPGKVRQVYFKEWRADVGGRTLTFKAKVVETDSATNPGDSGGPLINDKGELVGVTQGGAIGASLVSTFVDISEVKHLLNTDDARSVKGSKPIEIKLREKPAKASDSARIFSEETMKKVQTLVNEIHEKKKFDVLVETFATAPNDDTEKVNKMTATDRRKYMHEWVKKRMTAEKVQGLGILICNNPKSLYIELSDGGAGKYSPDVQKSLVEMLTEGLKNKKPDEAIVKLLEKVRDDYGKK